MSDITNREHETAIDHLRNDVRELQGREREHHFEICKALTEYWRDIERLKTAVRQIQAALNLPQLADDDEPSITDGGAYEWAAVQRLIEERNEK